MDRGLGGTICCSCPEERELGRQDSNLRMPGPKPGALPDLATPQQDGSDSRIALDRSASLYLLECRCSTLWLLTVLDKLPNDPIV